MKKDVARTVCLFAALFILAAGGRAVAETRFELGAGIASPVGNLQDTWNTKFGLNGALLFEITPFVSGGISASYNTLGLDAGALKKTATNPETYVVSGGDASIISVCGELRAQTGVMEKAVFYGGAGLGLYVVGFSDITAGYPGALKVTSFDTKNRFGGFVNAGFAIPVFQMIRVGARVQYNIYWVHEGGGEAKIVDVNETSSFLAVQGLVMIAFGG